MSKLPCHVDVKEFDTVIGFALYLQFCQPSSEGADIRGYIVWGFWTTLNGRLAITIDMV
jgi:hypothetical protein